MDIGERFRVNNEEFVFVDLFLEGEEAFIVAAPLLTFEGFLHPDVKSFILTLPQLQRFLENQKVEGGQGWLEPWMDGREIERLARCLTLGKLDKMRRMMLNRSRDTLQFDVYIQEE